MSDYRQLKVWERAHTLTLKIYKITDDFPKSELYGLVSQIRRASSSIPINIAEGCGSLHKKEFVRYLSIARSSINELDYELLLSKDLNYINGDTYNELLLEIKSIQKMINGLMKSINENKK